MRYSESLRYLNSFLNLERITLRPNNRLWNLKRIKYLLDLFGHPQKDFFPLLIAGTKGKGSTGFFLESILEQSGLRTGFYSSPHLEDPRERIRLRGKAISKREWTALVRRIQKTLGKKEIPHVNYCHSCESRNDNVRLDRTLAGLTYFEILTLMAILCFQKRGVEIGIFEVGMGGRLDATNILAPKLVLLTPVHLDHEAILGNTVGKIAREKAAIIGRKAYAVTSPQSQEALIRIKDRVKKMKACLFEARPVGFPVGLQGDFQRTNAGVAARAAEVLRENFGFKISENAVHEGLKSPRAAWPGRFEFFCGKPSFLLDAAHNPASVEALARNLRRLYAGRKRILIFSASKDKNSALMLKILSRFFSRVILVPNPTPKTQEIHVLLLQARGFFKEIFPAGSVSEALELAKRLVDYKSLVVVTGSFYLIGDARKKIRS